MTRLYLMSDAAIFKMIAFAAETGGGGATNGKLDLF